MIRGLTLLIAAQACWARLDNDDDIVPMIMNGANISQSIYSYVAGLLIERDDGTSASCLGIVLNDPNDFAEDVFILTAAQCASNMKDRDSLAFFNNDVTNLGPLYRRQIHPDYNSTNNLNDVAIVAVPKLDFRGDYLTDFQNVKPAELPIESDPIKLFGKRANIVGFGTTPEGGLQQAEAPILFQLICDSLPPKKNLLEKTTRICTLSYKSTICMSDLGAPLVVALNSTETVVGIASAPIRPPSSNPANCVPSIFNVFSYTGAFTDWISDVINISIMA